jgi:hypothetical protein
MTDIHATKLRLAVALTLVLGLAVLPALLQAAAAPAIVGNWEGALSVGAQSLPVQLHFTQAKDGTLTGTLVSPTQSNEAIPMDKVDYKEPTLHFEVPAIAGSYDGSYDKAKDEISGQWKQGGQSLPLVVKRAK